MLPPVLEIYVIWHPDDADGQVAADQFIEHFHGAAYTGLIGGAVEVYVRSAGWRSEQDAPRPIPIGGSTPPNGVARAELTAIVPVLGLALADAVQAGTGPWHDYLTQMATAWEGDRDHVGVFPLRLTREATDGTVLGQLISRWKTIAAPGKATDEPEAALRCRDLAQSITRLADSDAGRLQVFISHTKWAAQADEPDVMGLIDQVRTLIANTRLREFFDAHDLEPGQDWDADLRRNAASNALLVLRTDLYSSREWCQREVLLAKQAGMPVVVLDALAHAEQRGSFLMDHVPRVRAHRDEQHWRTEDLWAGLNILVDECLKRALWRRQQALAKDTSGAVVAWWAPHAPEPTTLVDWFQASGKAASELAGQQALIVLHPDPPMGIVEKQVLQQMARLMGIAGELDIMTPRGLAARGG